MLLFESTAIFIGKLGIKPRRYRAALYYNIRNTVGHTEIHA